MMYRTQQRLQTILMRKGVQGLADPCADYFHRNRKHLYGGLIVMCIFAVVIPQTIITTSKKFVEILPHSGSGEYKEYEKFHEMIDNEAEQVIPNEDTATPFGTCTIKKPMHPSGPMNPILVASFPGSSSDLMRLLIEAMTGLWTSARSFRDDVIAIKTHYPYYENHINVDADELDPPKGIVVMRNPLETLETFYDFIVMASTNDASHDKIPSVDNWVHWRDVHFDEQIKHWETFMRYWLDAKTLDDDKRHIVIHDALIDENSGPSEAAEMVKFIQQASSLPDDVDWDNISCLWSRVVKFQFLEIAKSTREVHPTRRMLRDITVAKQEIEDRHPHSYVQLDKVAAILTVMIEDYAYDQKILQALMGYRMNCLERMQKYKGEDPVLVSNDRGSCMVTTPQYEPMVPMYQASYPGSGSEMMRDVLEAITGVKTTETKRRNDVIAIKTYYPYRPFDVQPSLLNRDMKKVVLVLRYPLHAIASNFNHVYWSEHNLPHREQPPMAAWEEWRDEHFESELNSWVNHLNYWTKNFKAANRLVISYESLTDKDKGPQDVMRLALFIRAAYNEGTINPAPAFTLPCLWFRSVKVNDEIGTDRFQDNRFHTAGNYAPTFTNSQLEMAATELSNLHVKFGTERRIGPIIQHYWEHTVLQISE